jgi:prepilin-type N-terminal cleavage/methylation domain-containing protein
MPRGFSLIELLIVMAILAILATVSLVSFRGMQEETYVTKTTKEMETVQIAIEAYYKKLDKFPTFEEYSSGVLANLTPKLLSELPEDHFKTFGPVAGAYYYTYTSNNDDSPYGKWYMIGSRGPDRNWQSSYSEGLWYQVGDDIIKSNLSTNR